MMPGARIHRPYARKPGGPPSVTTVLSVLDKPGLYWASARETATFAVLHQDQWIDLPTDQAVDRIRRHFKGIWDHRAALGTAVHQVNEAWAHGEEVDLNDIIDQVQAENRVWAKMDVGQIFAELSVMVDGLEEAWRALRPETISAEDVVRYSKVERQVYIGQNDWRVRIHGHSYLVDVKTSGQTDPDKGFYPDSWRLQLAAYRGCNEKVLYDDNCDEIHTEPLPPVERCAILHIRANGKWAFLPVAAGGTEHNHFLRLRDLYGWLKSEGKRMGADMFIPEDGLAVSV